MEGELIIYTHSSKQATLNKSGEHKNGIWNDNAMEIIKLGVATARDTD